MAHSPDTAAGDVYEVETRKAPALKRWGSTVLSGVVAVATLGGSGSEMLVVGQTYQIRELATGNVLGTLSDSVEHGGKTGAVLESDLQSLSAEEFASKWL